MRATISLPTLCNHAFGPHAFRRSFQMCLVAFHSLACPLLAEEPAWVADAVVEKAKQAIVAIERVGMNGYSTGYFATQDGLVVTLAAELAGCQAVVIHTADGQKIRQNGVLAFDEASDLAVLATKIIPPVHLPLAEKPVTESESCVVVFPLNVGQMRAADVKLLARREVFDRSGTRILPVWSFALSLNSAARTGTPLVTGDGKVAGLFFQLQAPDIQTRQRRAYAVPQGVIASILATAGKARQLMPIPAPGSTGHNLAASADSSFQEAIVLAQTGDAKGASAKFEQVLKRHPQSAWVREQLAACLFDSGDLSAAQTVLEDAARLFPNHPEFQVSLANLKARRGNLKEALSAFESLTKTVPQFGNAWKGLGDVHLFLGDKTAADAAFRKWAELEPDSMLAWRALSQTGTFAQQAKATTIANDLESLYFRLRYKAPHRD